MYNLKKTILYLIFICNSSFIFADELKKTEIYKGVTASLPGDFVLMSDDDIAAKVPSFRKPLSMFTDPNRVADFGFNTTLNRWQKDDLELIKDFYKSTINTLYDRVEFFKEGEIVTIKKRKYIVFEFIGEALNTSDGDTRQAAVKNYSHIMYTQYKDKILVFNFSCPTRVMNDFQNNINATMNSLKIKGNIALPEFKHHKLEPKPKRIIQNPR